MEVSRERFHESTAWCLMEDKRGVIGEWAEVDYVPTKNNEKREAKPYRYVGLRLRRQQCELLGDVASVRYFAVVSNIRDLDGQPCCSGIGVRLRR